MPLLRLAEMTWTEVRDLDRRRAVALLPVGATEAHGPHLPLGTDAVIAAAMAEAGAERLAAAGYLPLLLPGLPYTAAPFAADFPGTVAVRGETVTALVLEIARALAAQAIPVLALANAHLDPAHTASLHAAVAAIGDEGLLTPVFPDVTRKPWALRLSAEFRSGACHAGRYEGSIVLAARPALVRDELRRALPPNPASLSVAIRQGKRSFAEAGGPEAYFGAPAEATRAEGETTLATLGQILAEAVLAAVGGGGRGAGGGRP
jgi:creatinine amidohydrolase